MRCNSGKKIVSASPATYQCRSSQESAGRYGIPFRGSPYRNYWRRWLACFTPHRRDWPRGAAFFIYLYGISFIAAAASLTGNGTEEYQYPFKDKDRDPLRPLINKKGRILIPREIGTSGLMLKGIIYSKDGSLAVISDEVLEEGDKIGEYSVFKIEEKKVILRNKEKELILKLEE